MKQHLKILTAFACLALPNLCCAEQEFDVEMAISSKSNSSSVMQQKQLDQEKDNSTGEQTAIFMYFYRNVIKQLKNIYHSPALPEYSIQVASSVTSGLILYGLYYAFSTSKP
jgi:carbonic anhydrase